MGAEPARVMSRAARGGGQLARGGVQEGAQRLGTVPSARPLSIIVAARVPAILMSVTPPAFPTPVGAAVSSARSNTYPSLQARPGCLAAAANAAPDVGVPTVGARSGAAAGQSRRCISPQHVGRAAAGAAGAGCPDASTLMTPMRSIIFQPVATPPVPTTGRVAKIPPFVTPLRGVRRMVSPSPVGGGCAARESPPPLLSPHSTPSPSPIASVVAAMPAALSNGLFSQHVGQQAVRLSSELLPGMSKQSILSKEPCACI